MSWFSKLLFGNDPAPTATDAAFKTATANRGQQADAATKDYQTANAGFDPKAAYADYTKGAIGDFNTQLSKQLTTLKGSEAGAGRLDSGFYDQDQGKVVTDLGTNLQNQLSQQALNVTGLQEQDINRRGNYASGVNQDYNDLLAGQLDRETAQQNAKRQQRGAFITGLASVAGSALGRA